MEKRKLFYLTIDVEEDLGTLASKPKEFIGVTKGLPLFFDILDSLKINATFFVTGEVASKFPEMIREIHRNQEVACHGLYHIAINKFDVRTNRQYLLRSTKILHEIMGSKPLGFRTVNNVINDSFIKLLEELGFTYDSSVLSAYPLFKEYMGFKGNAPRYPYHPNCANHRKKGDCKILEMPISAIPLINFPWSGTWIRTLGKSVYKLSALLSEPSYVLLALHSWDFINLKGKTLHSRNSGKVFAKILKDLLLPFYGKGYNFLTLIEGSKMHG